MGSERITVSLIPQASEHLHEIIQRTGLTKTDIINRAISMYEFVDREMAAGAEVVVQRNILP